MTTASHTSVTTFTKDTDRTCINVSMGKYTDATEDLHCVMVHDVTKVTRKTKRLKNSSGTKVVTITLHTATGPVDIHAFIEA